MRWIGHGPSTTQFPNFQYFQTRKTKSNIVIVQPRGSPIAYATKPGEALRSSSMTHCTSQLPKLVAFDLDATLWSPEMYELYGPPFKLAKNDPHCVLDGSGDRVTLMGASREILKELATEERWRDTIVAYVSRTEHPKWADSCLKLFSITPGISMFDIGQEQEIYPGGKKTHFRRIHERTGIPYEEMLFFDNESWNISDVSPVGVVSVHCPRGMTNEIWVKGLEAHAAATEARRKGEKPKLAIMSKEGRYW